MTVGTAVVSALCLAVALGSSLAGCNDAALFTDGRDLQVCTDDIPAACGEVGRCVLDTSHYIQGQFPGAISFVVRTTGETDLQLQAYLYNRESPGTVFRVTVSEAMCTNIVAYDNAGADVFQKTGPDDVLYIPVHVTSAGDHLVQVMSDAYSAYDIAYQ